MNYNDALYNSIYIMIGIAYDWNTQDLASFYGVTTVHFELWLDIMGFEEKEIKELRDRDKEILKPGKCIYCSMLSTTVFCNDLCEIRYNKNREILTIIQETKIIPSSIYRNTTFNVRTGRIKCLR